MVAREMQFKLYIAFVWLLSWSLSTLDKAQCLMNAHHDPGETFPYIIEVSEGDSFNITCRMNPKRFPGQSSKDLYFINTNTHQRVPSEELLYVNDTSIVYVVPRATRQKSTYLCKCGQNAITSTNVYVGTPPQPVEDFQCHSFDFEYMECNFTEPPNPVLTVYKLRFHIYSTTYEVSCDYQMKPQVICNITKDQLRNVEDCNFTIFGKNTLGQWDQNFHINYYDVMQLAAPGDEFNVISLTSQSIEVSWRMKKWEYNRRRSLQWEILLIPEHLPVMNLTSLSKVERQRNEMRLRLDYLPYAFYVYELRLRVRFQNAIPIQWSEPFNYKFRTAARRPDRPPTTNRGCFHVDSSETSVKLYWEELNPREYNGHDFTYVIDQVWENGTLSNIKPTSMEPNSATFAWQKQVQYKFEIRSQNALGASENASYIEIFPVLDRHTKKYKPNVIHNAYHDSNNSYTLTWKQPEIVDGLISYTVFWCFSKRALQNECNGSIHFREVGAEVLRFETSPQNDGALNLAVSANYINFNTGIQWTACTEDVNSNLIRMEPAVKAQSATILRIEWTQSICPSILIAYILLYCEWQSGECIDRHNVTIDKNAIRYDISDLKPYTKYQVQMYMKSRTKVGRISEPVYGETREDAPSPPRQLQVTNITNTSAMLTWLPPSQPNGIIRNYIIHLGTRQISMRPNSVDNQEKIVYKLTNLTSYMVYKAYVVAQTVQQSLSSNDLHFKTLIGYPTIPENVEIKSDKTDDIQIRWSKPSTPNGRVECYEVSVTQLNKEGPLRRYISVVCGVTSCALRIPYCRNEDHRANIDVRAVNMAHLPNEVGTTMTSNSRHHADGDNDGNISVYADNGEFACVNESGSNSLILNNYHNMSVYRLYKSNWHKVSVHQCSINVGYKYLKPIILTVMGMIVILIVVLMLCMVKKRIYKMANIKCELPPELDVCLAKDTFAKDVVPTNEKFHLLSNSLGNDSFIQNITDCSKSISNSSFGIQQPRHAASTGLKPEQEITAQSEHIFYDDSMTSMNSLPIESCTLSVNAEKQNVKASVPCSGYVALENLAHPPAAVLKPYTSFTKPIPPACSSYVTAEQLCDMAIGSSNQGPTIGGSYTTMTELKQLGLQ